MIPTGKFAQLQKLFYNKIAACCNPVEVTLTYLKTTGGNRLSNFTGDNNREPDKIVNLHCLYQRDLNDKQRERLGVNQDVTDVLYISPLELQKQTGSSKFPPEVMASYAFIAVEFLGKHYELVNIKPMEPMHNGKIEMCIAYQLNLRATTGNYDYN